MDIINMTPHDVVIIDADSGEETRRYPRSGDTLRLETRIDGQTPDGFVVVSFGHLAEDPPMRAGVFYIVSLPTALAVRRQDFLVPFEEVRDDAGRIIGCRRLAHVL